MQLRTGRLTQEVSWSPVIPKYFSSEAQVSPGAMLLAQYVHAVVTLGSVPPVAKLPFDHRFATPALAKAAMKA
jgi:hypothetical protein